MNKFITFLVCLLSGLGIVVGVGCLVSPRDTWSRVAAVGRGLRHRASFRLVLVAGVALTFFGTVISPILGVAASVAANVVLMYGMVPSSKKKGIEVQVLPSKPAKAKKEEKAPPPAGDDGSDDLNWDELKQFVRENIKAAVAEAVAAEKKKNK